MIARKKYCSKVELDNKNEVSDIKFGGNDVGDNKVCSSKIRNNGVRKNH